MGDRLKVYSQIVNLLSSLSKCTDKKQAAIILDKQMMQILSIGINGGPMGGENCLCVTGGKYSCIHAEAQALVKLTLFVKDKVMICTTEPCQQCAAMILNELGGFQAVYWLQDWKEHYGSNMLQAQGVSVGQLNLDGVLTVKDMI